MELKRIFGRRDLLGEFTGILSGLQKVLLFVLISVIPINSFSQDPDLATSDESAKAILLFYVSNLVDWPEKDSLKSFNIGVQSKEASFAEELRKISKNYTIHNKPVSVLNIDEYEDPEDVNVIFIDKTYYKEIDKILNYCKQHKILQITDELEKKQYTVVNFVKNQDDNSYGYEVNKDNLDGTGLTYEDELLLYGGTIKDLRELYNTTTKLLHSETQKVIELSETILQKDTEISSKNASIDSLAIHITNKRDTLSLLKSTLKDQTNQLEQQRKVYAITNDKLQHVETKYVAQVEEIKKKEDKVNSLDSVIKLNESIINNQTNAIKLKDLNIAAKEKLVFRLIWLGAALGIISLLIYWAYFIKKRNNRLLEEKVKERTKKISNINTALEEQILQRKRYEAELSRSEKNYREIFNSSTNGMCIFSLDGKLLNANTAMLQMYGYTIDELKTLHFKDICFKDNLTSNIAESYLQNILKGDKVEFDSQTKRKTGDEFWIDAALYRTNIGEDDCILTVIRDVDEKKRNAIELESYRLRLEQMVEERTGELKKTNRELFATNEKLNALNADLEKQKLELKQALDQLKKAQEKLVDSEKMAAIGIMAAGVAHEINNPLNYIKGGVFGIKSILKEKVNESEEIIGLMKGIDNGVDRAATIVSSLKHFSRKSDDLNENCNLHTIIDNCLTIAQNAIKNNIEVVKQLSDDKIVCKGNDGKLHQVILNVLTNAAQAIPGEGKIWISTGKTDDNKNVFVEIKDSGEGIKPELLDKITTPFFTTKEVGKGTGLGLSITKKIISDHKGNLNIVSEENIGTTVTIELPMN